MKGILFTEDMFNAVIEGRKTQTRRIINPQPSEEVLKSGFVVESTNPDRKPGDLHLVNPKSGKGHFARPRYNAGETVYLKEPYIDDLAIDQVFYKFKPENNQDIEEVYGDLKGQWKNKLFMPADAARYFIKITKVRAERVADISEEDAIAEGIKKEFFPTTGGFCYYFYPCNDLRDDSYLDYPKTSFYSLWKSINGQKSWDENPWVWVYEFELLNDDLPF